MVDDLRHRIGGLFYAQDQPIEYMRPIPWEDAERRVPAKYTHCMKMADAAITACDPIDTATGLTWKERFLERGAWQPISEAKADGTVYPVWVAPYQGLDGFLTVCSYHPDAGWCADELREVTHFVDCPLTAPDKRKVKERRVWNLGGPANVAGYYDYKTKRSRRKADRRKAQPETSEVERDGLKARYATPSTDPAWEAMLVVEPIPLVPAIQRAERVLDQSEIDYLLGFTDKDGNELTGEQMAELDKRHAAMYPPDEAAPDKRQAKEPWDGKERRLSPDRRWFDQGGAYDICGDTVYLHGEMYNRRGWVSSKDRRQTAQPETSDPTLASRMTLTQPCDVCGKPVLVNAVSPSECFCSPECATAHLDEPETGEVK